MGIEPMNSGFAERSPLASGVQSVPTRSSLSVTGASDNQLGTVSASHSQSN